MLKGIVPCDPDEYVVRLHKAINGTVLTTKYLDDDGVERAAVLKGIYSSYECAKWCKSNISNTYVDIHAVISSRFIMSNDLSYVRPDARCIWYPEQATEQTYRELYNMNAGFSHQIAKACIIAGYNTLLVSMNIRVTTSLIMEACFIGNVRALRHLLDIGTETYNMDDIFYRSCETFCRIPTTPMFVCPELKGVDTIECIQAKVDFAMRYKRGDLYHMLQGDIPPDKNLMSYYAYHSNVNKYKYRDGINSREVFCLERGVLRSYEFAKVCRNVIPYRYSSIHDFISGTLISCGDLTYVRCTAKAIGLLTYPKYYIYDKLVRMNKVNADTLGIAIASLHNELIWDMPPSIHMLRQLMTRGVSNNVKKLLYIVSPESYDAHVDTLDGLKLKYDITVSCNDGRRINNDDITYDDDRDDPLCLMNISNASVASKVRDIDTLLN